MQNRTFLVVLRPNFGEKLKIAPTHWKTAPPQTYEYPIWAEKSLSKSVKTFFFFFFGDHLILGGKNLLISDFGRKISLKICENLFFFFFLENIWFSAEKTFEYASFFGQIVWNWFKFNENSSQGRLHTSDSFKIAPPFSKSWLRAWGLGIRHLPIFRSQLPWCTYSMLCHVMDKRIKQTV